MLVEIKYDSLGVDLGPFTLTPDWGNAIPDTATRQQLLDGFIITIDDENATQIMVTSTGFCDVFDILAIDNCIYGNGTATETVLEFKMVWDDIANVPVADAYSVSDWNTFFDLPNKGNEFTYVEVSGNTVVLYGASGVTLKDHLFGGVASGNSLLEVIDTNCVVACGEGVFSDIMGGGCYSLTKVHLPVCTSLGEYTFVDCEAMSDLLLPFGEYTTLGNYIFYSCRAISSFSFPNLLSAGNNCFAACRAATEISAPLLQSAGNYCFYSCDTAMSFNFPDLTSIGAYCFQACSNATSFNIYPPTTLPDGCFMDCVSIATFSFPDLVSAGNYCFKNCSALTSISLPALETAGSTCFGGCGSVTTLSFPVLTALGDGCFETCMLLSSLSIPSCVSLGSTTGNDTVFIASGSGAITLTIPAALMTCNGGNPDGDIIALQSTHTVTIIQI